MDVYLPKNLNFSRSYIYGFVRFKTLAETHKAICGLNNTSFNNRRLSLSLAKACAPEPQHHVRQISPPSFHISNRQQSYKDVVIGVPRHSKLRQQDSTSSTGIFLETKEEDKNWLKICAVRFIRYPENSNFLSKFPCSYLFPDISNSNSCVSLPPCLPNSGGHNFDQWNLSTPLFTRGTSSRPAPPLHASMFSAVIVGLDNLDNSKPTLVAPIPFSSNAHSLLSAFDSKVPNSAACYPRAETSPEPILDPNPLLYGITSHLRPLFNNKPIKTLNFNKIFHFPLRWARIFSHSIKAHKICRSMQGHSSKPFSFAKKDSSSPPLSSASRRPPFQTPCIFSSAIEDDWSWDLPSSDLLFLRWCSRPGNYNK